MPARSKRTAAAEEEMEQDGDDIEAITAVSSWMYEFCSRNNMVDAMYGMERNAARAPPQKKHVNIRCHARRNGGSSHQPIRLLGQETAGRTSRLRGF